MSESFTVIEVIGDKLLCNENGKKCMCDPDCNGCGQTMKAILKGVRP